MSRKLVLLFFVSFFAISALVSRTTPFQSFANTLNPTLAETVHNLNTGLNYTTIQTAINAVETLDGHTILVDAGTYYEHVVVNKSISLIGQDRSTTIIDGGGAGSVVTITKNNVNVTGFTMQHCGLYTTNAGIYLNNVNHCNITRNNITANNGYGIHLDSSSNNTVSGNNITNNRYGVILSSSSNNTIVENDFSGCGLGVSESYSNVVVGNSVNGKSLVYLEDASDLVVNDAGQVILVGCDNITVENLDLSNTTIGVELWKTNNTKIRRSNITNNQYNILGLYSSNNSISGNNITNNGWDHGIKLYHCSNNTICENNITNNHDGIHLMYSSDNNIYGNNITNNDYGIGLDRSSNNTQVHGNSIRNNNDGIWLYFSSKNTISGNDITCNSDDGISFYYSSDNNIYHNSFADNTNQVTLGEGSLNNTWDNGVEGNYWSNYTGTDANHDGISDSWYEIDANNIDHYPLMGLFHSFNTSLGMYVNVVSNSTIENFQYFDLNTTIKMYVSGELTFGFCRVCISHTLMDESSISVVIDDGATTVLHQNYNVYDNGTHRWIYFAYEHTTHKIDIIPEFPSLIITPLFMVAALLAVIVCKRKQPF